MKTMKNLLTITLISLSLLISCQKEESKEEDKNQQEITYTFDSTSLKTSVVESDNDQPFFFRYKFKNGESFKYRLTTISQSEQSLSSDTTLSESMNQTIIFIINFKTLSIDQDSVADLECNFTSVNLKANIRGNDVSYQSGSQLDSAEILQFAEYESFINNPFSLRVSKLGEIIDIYKIEKIINKYFTIRGLLDSLDAQQKIIASQELTSKSFKPLLTQIFRVVPEHKMAKDSTWTYKRESLPVMIFQMDYENQYKVVNLEKLEDDKLAVVTGSVKTQITGDPNYSERGIKYNFDKPISTATGKIYFNLDKGLIQKTKTESRTENGYKMEMPSPDGIKKASAKEVTLNVNIIELL